MSDEDIVEGTPEKPSKKKNHNKKKNYNRITKKHPPEEHFIQRSDREHFPISHKPIEQTLVLDFDQNKPHVYHDIKTVLNYTENYLPRNNQIHLVGIYKETPRYGPLLQKYYEVNRGARLHIPVDLKLTAETPDDGQTVSMYGFVEFRQFSYKTLPVFMVKFWRKLVGDINKTIKNFELMLRLVPTVYLTTITLEADYTYLDVSKNINEVFFEDCDEDILAANMSLLEKKYGKI